MYGSFLTRHSNPIAMLNQITVYELKLEDYSPITYMPNSYQCLGKNTVLMSINH